MSSESTQPTAPAMPCPRGKRRWLTYSLRTLFVLVTLACLAAYQAGKWWRQMEDEDAAIYALEAHFGSDIEIHRAESWYDSSNPEHVPLWFRSLAGRKGFTNAYRIGIDLTSRPNDPELVWIKYLRGLTQVFIASPNSDGAFLEHLRELRHVQFLGVKLHSLDDGGLAALSSLPFSRLNLIVDSSTVHDWTPLSRTSSLNDLRLDIAKNAVNSFLSLSKLTSLHKLTLNGAEFQDADLAAIRDLTNLHTLELSFALDGRGLVHLTELPQLTSLYLNCEKLEASHLAHLRRMRLTSLDLFALQITEEVAASLAGLDQLETLGLPGATGGEWITRRDVVALFKRLPALKTLSLPPDLEQRLFPDGIDVHALRCEAVFGSEAEGMTPPRSTDAEQPSGEVNP